jgi:hypothetical protein
MRLQVNCSKLDGTCRSFGMQSELEMVLCNKNEMAVGNRDVHGDLLFWKERVNILCLLEKVYSTMLR